MPAGQLDTIVEPFLLVADFACGEDGEGDGVSGVLNGWARPGRVVAGVVAGDGEIMLLLKGRMREEVGLLRDWVRSEEEERRRQRVQIIVAIGSGWNCEWEMGGGRCYGLGSA